MKQGKRKAYQLNQEIHTPNGTSTLNLNHIQLANNSWIVSIQSNWGRLDIDSDDFEDLITNHLRHQGYTLWSPDEKVAAWAMAHMAGYLRGEDDLKYMNPFEQK